MEYDANWYNTQYADSQSRYGQRYAKKSFPIWAEQKNRLYAQFVIALTGKQPKDVRVLDLGSGEGHFVDAFRAAGADVIGAEWSHVAADRHELVQCLDITDLSSIPSGSFDIVWSTQVYEHLTDDQVISSFRHNSRIAPVQMHMIADRVGNDPSHINIKPAVDWVELFASISDRNVFAIPDPLHPFDDVIYCEMEALPPLMQEVLQRNLRHESI